MIEGNLDTTNLLLGIMAAASVVEAVAIVAIGVMGYKAYAAAMQAIRDIEQRQIAPLTARVHALLEGVDGVLGDVKGITSRMGAQTERVDAAIRSTIDRVDETADRVRSSMASKVHQVIGIVHGVRAAFDSLFNGHGRHESGEVPGRA